MGYRNDQFNNYDEVGEPTKGSDTGHGGGIHATFADNPAFIYPDRTIRTDDHNGHHATLMQRGYIRSLARTAQNGTIAVKKCQFQFNPTTLNQSVHASENMLNFLQQDPGQYAQPMGGTVNFAFDLVFDRSMEMNNATESQNLNPNVGNIWEMGNPSEVGVLRDISTLFACVGQGMSTQMQEYVVDSISREASAASKVKTETTADTAVTPDFGLADAINVLPKFLEVNVGNIAFLMPIPVRVVFSTLYIVEGLVNDTTVTFTKFNSSMVPMACSVTVSMEAKYIGFAKKVTFLTWALDEQKNDILAQAKADTALQTDISTTLTQSLNRMDIAVSLALGDNQMNEVQLGKERPSDGDMTSIPQYFGDGFAVGRPVDVFFKFPADSKDAVGKLFETDKVGITARATVEVFGPFPEGNGTLTTLAAAGYSQDALKAACSPSNSILYVSLPLASASDKKQWEDMVKGVKMKTTNLRTGGTSIDSGSITNRFITRYGGEVTAIGIGGSSLPLTTKGGSATYHLMQYLEDGSGPATDIKLLGSVSMVWPSPPPPQSGQERTSDVGGQ